MLRSSHRLRQSGAVVDKGQASQVLKKVAQTGTPLEDTLSENAFTVYNHARFGISISSMEMVARIANKRIADPGRANAMIP